MKNSVYVLLAVLLAASGIQEVAYAQLTPTRPESTHSHYSSQVVTVSKSRRRDSGPSAAPVFN